MEMEQINSSNLAVGNAGDINPDEKCRLLDEQHTDQKQLSSSQSPSTLEREICVEENSTDRTIEFLRARLLSERSVSKAARQKAQQLGQKVLELERQLEIVVEQRKNAEEDTRQALEWLENGKIADYFEAFVTGIDQDGASFEFKKFQGTNNATSARLSSAGEEDETSTMDSESEKTLGNSIIHTDESGRLEHSQRARRGLSWQTRGNYCNQYEKTTKRVLEQTNLDNHNHGGVSDSKPSSKRRIGKSCRQIKRRDTRPITEEELRVLSDCSEEKTNKSTESTLEKDFEGNSSSGDQKAIHPDSSNQVTEEGDEVDSRNDQIGEQTSGGECASRVHPECSVPYPSDDQDRQIDSGSDKEMEMERVLEQRAELIDLYEAEENAQREWEEKFRELNSSSEQSMDCCRHEKQTRETEEAKEKGKTFLNRSEDVATTINSEKKEDIEKSYESASRKSQIHHSKKLACSYSHNVDNGVMHDIDIKESRVCFIHRSLPASIPNLSCKLMHSWSLPSLNKVEDREVRRFSIINDNFPLDTTLGNMQKHGLENVCTEMMAEQEKQDGRLPSHTFKLVMDPQASYKEMEITKCVAKSSDNVDKNIVEPYWQDIGPNLREKAVLVLENHSANKPLEPSASVLHDKALDAMHTLGLPAQNAAEKLPHNFVSNNEIMDTLPRGQVLESGKHCRERKITIGNYDFSRTEGQMLTTGQKPQNVSHANNLGDLTQVTTHPIPSECIAYSQKWHGSCKAEQGIPLMQGHRIDAATNAICGSMQPCVSVDPMKSMSILDRGHVEIQGNGENRKHFTRTDFHGRGSTSDVTLKTRLQENMKEKPSTRIRLKENMKETSSSGQHDKSTGLSKNKIAIMQDAMTDMAKPNVKGAGFQIPHQGFGSSEMLDEGNPSVANHISDNDFSRSSFQGFSQMTTNKIPKSFGSHEKHPNPKDCCGGPQRTSERNDASFQTCNSRPDMSISSSEHGITSNYKDHPKGLAGGQLVIPTTGNGSFSSTRKFEPSFELHTGKSAREESRTGQTSQEGNRYARRIPSVAYHQSTPSKDVLTALKLAKLQLQNVLENTESVIEHPHVPASFMQESHIQKAMQSCSFVESPLSCTELFRLPSEVDSKLPSQIRVLRPNLPDHNHKMSMGVPRNLSASTRVPCNLSATTSARERLDLQFKSNESNAHLSRRLWLSSDNQNRQQFNYGLNEAMVARGRWSSADEKRGSSEKK